MELENLEANESCGEMPEAKRRKVSDDSEGLLDIESMKVKELKDALEERGLDSKGIKAVLKERLMEALAEETNGAPASKTEETADAQDGQEPPEAGVGNGHINGDIHMDEEESSRDEPSLSTDNSAEEKPKEEVKEAEEAEVVEEGKAERVGEEEDKAEKVEEEEGKVEKVEEDECKAEVEEDESKAEKVEEEEIEAEKVEEAEESAKIEETNDEKEEPEEEEEEEEIPPNPELDKYWMAVKDDPSDFTAWTYLLQYVEQLVHIRPYREAYDAFLKRYPYCYGYWKKYADMERKHENMAMTEKVFERGVEAIPLSIDLWIHYLNFYVDQFGSVDSDQAKIRKLYERAVVSAGLEFRSDKLWDHYIQWETSKKRAVEAFGIFKRLLNIPTQLYSANFEKFKTFVQSNEPRDFLSETEYTDLAKKINEKKKKERKKEDDADEDDDKEEEEEYEETGVIAPEDKAKTQAKIIEKHEKTYKNTEIEVSKRWVFEEGVKRPYFHVKPLEKAQLKNWKEYLDFEIENGTFERVVVLFERCVIACALYEEYWQKYIAYLKKHSVDAARSVYDRACEIHLQKKPTIHIEWAAFEESQGDISKAVSILTKLQTFFPDLLLIATRLVGIYRRRQDGDKVIETFDQCLADAKSVDSANFFSVKYARFLVKEKNFDKAREILRDAIKNDKDNVRLHLQLLEVEMRNEVVSESKVLKVFETLIKNEKNDDKKIQYSQRRLEFLEEQGSKIETLLQMHEEHQALSSRKRSTSERDRDDSKKHRSDRSSTYSSQGASNGNATPNSAPAPSTPAAPAPQWDPSSAAAGNWGHQQGQWGQWGQQQQQQWGQQQWGQQPGAAGYGYGYGYQQQ